MLAVTVLTGDWIEVPNECTIAGTTRTEIEVSGDEVILICPCCNGTGEHPWGANTYFCGACADGGDQQPHCALPRLEDFEPSRTGWPRQN
jgi:hypothetical protein